MDEFSYKPIYINTDEILSLVAQIAARVDVLTIQSGMEQNPKLRRLNRLKSIHSSLAIENNTLSLEQITALFDGKPVLAPAQDICEAKNAFEVYDRLLEYDPYDIMDLLTSHKILMKDLVKVPGTFRTGRIGVARGKEVVHIAPPADNVSGLIADLLRWTKDAQVHPLIKSCVFHYEFEIIHPFPDGNGRMGRMWQTLLLYRWKEIFAWLPVETMVWERQEEYYKAFRDSNDTGDCTEFIKFMLRAIWDTLEIYAETDVNKDVNKDVLNYAVNGVKLKIIENMLSNPRVSAKQLSVVTGINTRNVQIHIKALKEAGLIKRVGSKKGGYWDVKRK